MKHIFLLAVLGLYTSFAFAEISFQVPQDTVPKDTTWKKGANIGILFQQVGLSNWAGGGASAVSYGGEAELFLRKNKDNHTWNNALSLGYGVITNSEIGTRKNNDYLIFQSSYNRNITKKTSLTALVDFRTQFAPGFRHTDTEDILISNFMAPGFFIGSLGYTIKEDDLFAITMSALSNKTTFVFNEELSNQGAFGVDPGERIRAEFGASLTGTFKKEIMTNVELRTNLLLFMNYETPRSIDVNWDLFLVMKINKFLTTNFTLQMIYDDDIDITRDDGSFGPALQIRNVLNIGLNFKL